MPSSKVENLLKPLAVWFVTQPLKMINLYDLGLIFIDYFRIHLLAARS